MCLWLVLVRLRTPYLCILASPRARSIRDERRYVIKMPTSLESLRKKSRSAEAFLISKEINDLKRVTAITVVTVHQPGVNRTCGGRTG